MKRATIALTVAVAGVGVWAGLNMITGCAPAAQPPVLLLEVPPPTTTNAPTPTTTNAPTPTTTNAPAPAPALEIVPTTTLPQPIEPVAPVTTTLPPPQVTEILNPSLDSAGKLIAEGKKSDARLMLTNVYLNSEDAAVRKDARKLLDEINAELFFSKAPSPDCATVTIQRGDTLSHVADRNKKDVYFSELIQRINGIADPSRIRVGQKIKVPQGTFSGWASKSRFEIVVLLNGHYIKAYPIAIGASVSPTPEGKLVVATKQKNPDWYAPDGSFYKFGDPKNLLGTRWIGFQGSTERSGYGIHGTADPETIGQAVSNGCIRMNNADVEEVFGMLMIGDAVEIVK